MADLHLVRLTADEWEKIEHEADRIVQRSSTSRKGLTPAYQNTSLRTGFEIGFAGELAVAKFLELRNHIEEDYDQVKHGNDVGNLEVRTRSKTFTNIGIKDYEFQKFSGSQRFVLCWLDGKDILIAGWQTLSFIKNNGVTDRAITYCNYRRMRDAMELLS